MSFAIASRASNAHINVTDSKPVYKFEVIDLQHGYITQGVYWVAELVQDFFNNIMKLLNISYQFSFANNNFIVGFNLRCEININERLYCQNGKLKWGSHPNFNNEESIDNLGYEALIKRSPQDFSIWGLASNERLGDPEKCRIFKFAHRPPNISYVRSELNKVFSPEIAEQDDVEREKLVDAKQVKLVDVETKAKLFILRFKRNPVVIANNIVVCDNFKLEIPMQAPAVNPACSKPYGPETIPVECSRSYSVPRSLGKPKVSIIQSE